MKIEKLDYKLDTLGYGVLQHLRGHGLDDAVIAGGYIRDQICKRPFKDIDIFLPKMSVYSLIEAVNNLGDVYQIKNTSRENFGNHGKYAMNFNVLDVNYLGEIPLQIIGTNFSRNNFHFDLLNSFDFGICQVFSEGEDILGTEEFKYDRSCGTATLLTLRTLQELPRHMKRFIRLQEKFPNLTFRCPMLSINNRKEKDVEVRKGYNYNPSLDVLAGWNLTPSILGNNLTAGITLLDEATTLPVPEAPAETPDYLSLTLNDILNSDETLNWDLINEAYSTMDLAINEHMDQLLSEYDEVNFIPDTEEPQGTNG